MISALLLTTTWWGGGLVASVPPAERIEVSTTLSAATGVSMAGGAGGAWNRRSPAMIGLEVGLTHPQLPWLEISPGLMLEAEGRVGIGALVKTRFFLADLVDARDERPVRRRLAEVLRPYVLLGGAGFFAPYTLLGVQGGGGLEVRVHRRLGLALEPSATVFFLGDDLMERATLVKFDTAFALRAYFG